MGGACDRPLDSGIRCNKNSFFMTTIHFPATKTHFSWQQLISLQQKLISHDNNSFPCNKNSVLMTTTHFPATKTHFSRQQLISLQQKLISHGRRFLSIRLVVKLSLVSMRIIVLQACFSEIYQLFNSIISEWFCTLILERIFKTILCCAPFHG